MLRGLFACALFVASTAFAQHVTVPFVGCAATGMSGPVPAPSGEPRRIPIPADAAAHLALYSDGNGLDVLAPRGWHCYEVYGSDGGFLFVSPNSLSAETIYSPHGFTEPVVILSAIDGFTSGRDEVSAVINHVFPEHRAFVVNAAKEMDQPVPGYRGPFPGDKLHHISKNVVEYTTPAHREGIGTMRFLRASTLPTIGVEILSKDSGECCNLTSLDVRLAPTDAALAGVIRSQLEHELITR